VLVQETAGIYQRLSKDLALLDVLR